MQTAERHVRQAEALVRRQQRVILKLQEAGRPTANAEFLLRHFQRLLADHRADAQRLADQAHETWNATRLVPAART